MRSIKDLDELNNLIKEFFKRGTHTNCYFLIESFKKLIADNKLSYEFSGQNLMLLLDKSGFYQLYFYLNDLSTGFKLPHDKPIVMELLYRGEKYKPFDIINYWTAHKFKQHLSRDNMVASYESILFPKIQHLNILIDYAYSENQALFAEKLLRNSLDIYTGDLLSMDEIRHYVSSHNILIALYNNEMAGVLQFEVKNKIFWLGHIAVDEKHRGKGIANELIRKYILDNRIDDYTKYQLWVIQDNIAAVKLYRKFGFYYGNKSTISLLKE